MKQTQGPGHPECPERLSSIMDYMEKNSLEPRRIEPEMAKLSDITDIHSKAYLDYLKEFGVGRLDPDTAMMAHTYNMAMLAAGGGIAAAQNMLEHNEPTFALLRPPGHHATASMAMGFCYINNIAVAAEHLIEQHPVERVMIVDYDAHHGNGTQNAFYGRSDVLYVGLHQDGRTLFPGSGFPNEIGTGDGTGYNINLAMYPGAGDISYKMAFDEIILPVAESFKPDFLLVSSGFDAHYTDPLTSLGLTTSGYRMMNSKLIDIADKIAQGRLVYFLEGGYNIDVMTRASKNLVEGLSGKETTEFDDEHSESEICTNYTRELIDALRKAFEGIHF